MDETITLKVSLEWVTPKAMELVAKMARVSNPNNENNKKTAPKLLQYLIKHQHWSPWEMANACVYIECPRDISRQLLRHVSFRFQEFSGRYAEYPELYDHRELRLQDGKNRQNSLYTRDLGKQWAWKTCVSLVRGGSLGAYRFALHMGVAKEVARILLPEGLVPTRMYMNGTLRSWIHYINLRTGPETQKEHRDVAMAIRQELCKAIPELATTVGW